MAILNSKLQTSPAWAFRFFRRWARVLLPQDTKVFKFTGYPELDG